MTHPKLGKLVNLDPRTAWQNEAEQFTPWLAENLPLLNEALGLEIELTEREKQVGDFAVDIFGKEVGSGAEVVIENQLAPTDHGHLGQLLTYAAGLEAKIVIWISPRFRDEHSQVIGWLNRHTPQEISFFAVEMELLQIDDSPPAPHFKIVAEPSEWQKEIASETLRRRTPRELAYHDFFTDFLDRLKATSPGFTNVRRVGYDNWMVFGGGRTGFAFQPEFMRRPDRLVIQLNITTGDRDKNKVAFDQLLKDKAAIEAVFGQPLEWRRLDDKIECRIGVQCEGGVDSLPTKLDEMKDWGVEKLVKFRDVFGTRVKALRLEGQTEPSP